MPRLTDQIIFARISKAMQPQVQAGNGASPGTLDQLVQKAKERRSGTTTPVGKPVVPKAGEVR